MATIEICISSEKFPEGGSQMVVNLANHAEIVPGTAGPSGSTNKVPAVRIDMEQTCLRGHRPWRRGHSG